MFLTMFLAFHSCVPSNASNLPRFHSCVSCKLSIVVPKGIKRASLMEDSSSGGHGEPGTTVDAVTGEADKRLCFAHADLWRRILDPCEDDLESLQACSRSEGFQEKGVGGFYRGMVAPKVYDAVIGSVLLIIKRLDLRYETPDEGVRYVTRGRPMILFAKKGL